MAVHLIHGFAQLVQINKRAYKYQRTQNIPQPEIRSTEGICHTAALDLGADTIGDPVVPHKGCNSQSKRAYKEEQQAIMHGFFAVISAANDIHIA